MKRPEHLSLYYPDPDLADGLVRIRKWRLEDVGCVRQASTDEDITSGTTVPDVFTPDEGRAYIERQWSRLDTGVGMSLAVADATTDAALGQVYVAVRPQALVAGLGYWIVPDARGRGLATRAVRLASDWVLTATGAARIEAWATTHNLASQRVLAAAGFSREGVLRSFLGDAVEREDMVVFSRVSADL